MGCLIFELIWIGLKLDVQFNEYFELRISDLIKKLSIELLDAIWWIFKADVFG